jgi:phosphopantetheinyl transferase
LHAIAPDEHDKPQIPGNQYHFSVTHSFPYVAAVVSTLGPVGIDLQCWHTSILKLQHKFLTPAEQLICGPDPQRITLAWCAKEAAYKYQGKRGIEFRDHLVMEQWATSNSIHELVIDLRLSPPFHAIALKGFIYDDFALSLTLG